MFYNIKTKDVRANGRGSGRVGTPYYIIRARVKDGVGGIDGGNGGIDRKGTPRGESRGGDFYWTGETRLQGRGKGVT